MCKFSRIRFGVSQVKQLKNNSVFSIVTKWSNRCIVVHRTTFRFALQMASAIRESALVCILLTALGSYDAVARPDCDATPDIPACGGNGGGSGGNSPATIREGGLYREAGAPEVYTIQGGKKVWIPTPDAL